MLNALQQCTSMVDDVDKILEKHSKFDVAITELRARNQQIEVKKLPIFVTNASF